VRLTHYPHRDAWLADARRGAPDYHLGATACAAILGHGYRTPWDVYVEAHHGSTQPDSAVLARGRRWESRGREDYELAADAHVWAPLARVSHPDASWLSASPDGIVVDEAGWSADGCPVSDDYLLGGWEGKTSTILDAWGEDGTTIGSYSQPGSQGVLPIGYAIQVYTLLACSGLPWWDLTVALPSRSELIELRTYRLMADPDIQALILDEVGEWRERHLVRGEDPPIDGSSGCAAHLARRYPGTGKVTVRATAEQAGLVRELAELKAEVRHLRDEERRLGNALKSAIGDGYGLALDEGGKALCVRVAGRRTVSLSGIEKARPDIYRVLEEADLIRTGEPSSQIRLYGVTS